MGPAPRGEALTQAPLSWGEPVPPEKNLTTTRCGSSSVVEHVLPKHRAVGSIPISRSKNHKRREVP